jgi:hypothetical protein
MGIDLSGAHSPEALLQRKMIAASKPHRVSLLER